MGHGFRVNLSSLLGSAPVQNSQLLSQACRFGVRIHFSRKTLEKATKTRRVFLEVFSAAGTSRSRWRGIGRVRRRGFGTQSSVGRCRWTRRLGYPCLKMWILIVSVCRPQLRVADKNIDECRNRSEPMSILELLVDTSPIH